MLRFSVDPSAALKGLDDAQKRQVPFAVSKALNTLANKAQAAERARITGEFRLKRKAWNLQGIYISKQDRSSKTSWRVVIQVQSDRSYLDKFEEGGEKVPHAGRRNLAIPNPSVFKSGVVPKGSPLKPTALNLRHVGGTWHGDERTFIAPFKGGGDKAGIFQRTDRKLMTSGKRGLKGLTLDNFAGGMGPNTKRQKVTTSRTKGLRLLYTLVSRVPIKAQLHFVETIGKTVEQEWAATMTAALSDALRTAR